jgi:flagellar hook-associated protein 3 FlgL
MRITATTLNRQVLHVINDRNYDISKLQLQLATGKRLQRPSDDPVDVANTLKLETKIKELTQFKKNINDGMSYMNVTDSAMESMNTLMQRARELAVQGASDTIGASERNYINKEAMQLFRQAVALVNTSFKGDYIFSGTQTKTPPVNINHSTALTGQDYTDRNMAYFNAAGQPVGTAVQLFNGFDNTPMNDIIPDSFKLNIAGVNYRENIDYTVDYENGTMTILNPALAIDTTPGTPNYALGQASIQFDYVEMGTDIFGQTISNWGDIYREIETGITMAINIPADELIQDPATGNTIINTFIQFGQSLVQNNRNGISDSIDNIDSVFNALLSAQSKNGSRINRFETTLTRNESQVASTTEIQSSLADTEMADAIMKFNIAQNVFDAALKTSAKIIQPSLVNFL